MSMYISLAWRNIWRNKRRSLITIASVFFAVILSLAMRSMQLGSYQHMVKNTVSFFTGYIQIHGEGYWDKKSLDRSMVYSKELLGKVESVKHVTKTAPRLESFALISGGDITDGAMVLGIDPEHEDKLTKLNFKLTEGAYLEKGDSDIMLAKGLADHIGAGIGDTIIVLGQGYHGVTAAGKYRVKGIVKYPTPDLNSRMSYLSISEAQRLFMAEGRITSLAVMIDRQKRLDKVTEELKTIFSDGYEVMTWEEMLPELVQSIETDNAGGVVMLGVIYMVIGFGMLGTILMMTLERNREFGMLMAVGMKRRRLRIIVLLESIFLSFIGVVAGTIAGIPILIYMYHHPIPLTGDIAKMMESYGWEAIMPFSLEPMIFVWQAVTVLLLAMIAALYPLWKISKLEPVTALRTG